MALLCTSMYSQASEPCPPEATTALVVVSVSVQRSNGLQVGSIPVDIGEPLIVTMAVVALDHDPITLGPTLAVEGGRMLLSIDGVSADITPSNGVPRFGSVGCATSQVAFVRVPYTPIRSGAIGITGNYVDGTTGVPGQRVSASGSTAIAVRPSPAVIAGPITNNANGHLYYLLSDNATWTASEAEAQQLGGHLVTITDQAEQDWVFTTFGSYGGINRSLWIGLNDAPSEGHFVWASGEPVTYTHWRAGQPDNGNGGIEHYAHMYNADGDPPGSWNDLPNSNPYPGFAPINGVVEVGGPTASIRVSQVEICWLSRTNALYNVEYRSSLTTNAWVSLFTNIAGAGGINCVHDPITVGQPQRYYRVEWVR